MQTVIVGLGAIGRMIVERLAGDGSAVRLAAVLVRPARAAQAREELAPDVAVYTSAEEGVAARPDMVVECAGQAALRQYG
jgi:aspartate dehydrogenase